MIRIILSLAAALFIATIAALAILDYLDAQKSAVAVGVIEGEYANLYEVGFCNTASSKPKKIMSPVQRVLVTECESNLTTGEIASEHRANLQKEKYLILSDGIGKDGILSVKGCRRGLIASINAGVVGGVTVVEQRVYWASAEYRRLPKSCKNDREQ
ncbi:hypothetical protein M2650_10290 [Luteimonas sp. SX5]|uniref:Uncharacterized protein n=1 Tax=Luteimonas galliterrae TaxID=2940486 RepID=A0ABT0MJH1_9GAMM|nr:hypothetical protein [Luteimonas galliterrae]MCL1635017.1 hypothetical protein [Luteimonas galliterrae]